MRIRDLVKREISNLKPRKLNGLGPHTWCRHVYLARTNLRLCHKGSVQSALHDHEVGGAYNSQSGCDQSEGLYHQEGVVYDHQTSSNKPTWQKDREENFPSYSSEAITDSHHSIVTRGVGKFQDEQTQKYLLRPDQPPDARVLRVAILGAPNAGKSTLVNHLLTWKVNPVSSKVHTTRRNSVGVFTEGNTQIVFTDTPGVITPAERKKHYCESSQLVDPKRSVEEVDLIGVLVDVANKYTREALHREILKILKDYQHIPSVLILNKVDQLKKPDVLLELINTLTDGVVGGAKVPATPVRKPKENKKEIANEMIDKLSKKYGKIERIDRTDESSVFQSDRPDKSWPESVNWMKGKRRENCKENFQSTDVKLNELDSGDTSVDYYSVTTGREESFRVRESSNKFEYFHDSLDNVKESCEKPVHQTGSSYEMTRNSNIEISEILTDSKYSAHKIKTERDTEGYDAGIKDFNENKTQESFKRTENNNKFKSEFFPNKVKTGKRVEPVRDLSKYVTPWDELMPHHREIKRGWQHFDRVFIVSSLTGDGMEDLKAFFQNEAVRGDWAFHSSMVTYEDPHELAKLIVWSKLLDHLKGYVAYQLEPDIAYWKYEDESTLKIVMNLKVKHVDRVIGPNGLIIRKIAEKSQQALMDAFRCEVALKLVVKKKISTR